MSAEKVIEAAEQVILRIKTARARENEEMLQFVIKKSVPNKLFAKFGAKPLTRSQAIEKMEKDIWSWYPSNTAGQQLNHARKLLTLAKHGDPVTLNEEDTNVLF